MIAPLPDSPRFDLVEPALDATRPRTTTAVRGHDVIVVLDRGVGAADIALRLRKAGYCALVLGVNAPASHVRALSPVGIVISGSGVANAPMPEASLLDGSIPLLAIADAFLALPGVSRASATGGQPGRLRVELMTGRSDHALMEGVFASGCVLVDAAPGARVDLGTWHALWRRADGSCGIACHRELPIMGIQPHPEATATTFGGRMLENFAQHACAARSTWTPARWAHDAMGGITEGIRGLPAAIVAEPSARSLCTVALTLRAVPAGRVNVLRVSAAGDSPELAAHFADAVEAQGAVNTETVDLEPAAVASAIARRSEEGAVLVLSGDLSIDEVPTGVVRTLAPLAGFTSGEIVRLAAFLGVEVTGLARSSRRRVGVRPTLRNAITRAAAGQADALDEVGTAPALSH